MALLPSIGIRQSILGHESFHKVNLNRLEVTLEVITMTSECGMDDLMLRSCIQGLLERVTGVLSQSTYNLPHNIS